MTDLEVVELALRRTIERTTGMMKYWLEELATEIVKILAERSGESSPMPGDPVPEKEGRGKSNG